jgi:endoglucanase
MRLGLWLWTAGAVLAAAWPARAADVFAQNQQLGRGVNIIGYDPIWKNFEQAHFKTKHFAALHAAGFQHVRINIHPFRHMQGDKQWALPESWWTTLDWAVREASAQQLMVILDFHEFQKMGEDAEGHKARFLAFWKQLAAHCASAPDNVLFEILNEPNKQMTPALWNRYLAEALAIIREKNPTRTVIVGPAFWNSVDHLGELELPEGDRHLIVTVHYYIPMSFTHQGASWAGQQDKHDIAWPASEKDRATLNNNFDKVAAWAKAHNRPIYLGEFGAYDKAPLESRVRYTDAVARAAEVRGWSWGYWQFDGDFILWDMKRDAFVEPILHALIPIKKGNQP